MQQIIDGLRYDTDEATVIGSDGYGSGGDFHHWEAALYVSKNGRYFLAGSGGAMSEYCQEIGQNSWTGGSRIDVLTEDQAFGWAEGHLKADVVEAFFGDRLKDA